MYCYMPLSLPTLRLARVTLKHRFTWNCSPQCSRFTSLVSVPVTKHCCLTAVNRYGTLCCPDFPLGEGQTQVFSSSFPSDEPAYLFQYTSNNPLYSTIALNGLLLSGIRESNPPPKLGKLMHYRCANAAFPKKRLQRYTIFSRYANFSVDFHNLAWNTVRHLAAGHRLHIICLNGCNTLCSTDLYRNLHFFCTYNYGIAMQVFF